MADEGVVGMKKKVSIIGIVAAVTAMSLGVAAPARAEDCPDLPGMPPLSTVTITNEEIRIDPGGPDNDAENAVWYAANAVYAQVNCGLGMVPAQAWCAYALIYNAAWNNYYVYQDYTGDIVIEYARFLADTNACI